MSNIDSNTRTSIHTITASKLLLLALPLKTISSRGIYPLPTTTTTTTLLKTKTSSTTTTTTATTTSVLLLPHTIKLPDDDLYTELISIS